jgi:hypothetical protein
MIIVTMADDGSNHQWRVIYIQVYEYIGHSTAPNEEKNTTPSKKIYTNYFMQYTNVNYFMDVLLDEL